MSVPPDSVTVGHPVRRESDSGQGRSAVRRRRARVAVVGTVPGGAFGSAVDATPGSDGGGVSSIGQPVGRRLATSADAGYTVRALMLMASAAKARWGRSAARRAWDRTGK